MQNNTCPFLAKIRLCQKFESILSIISYDCYKSVYSNEIHRNINFQDIIKIRDLNLKFYTLFDCEHVFGANTYT